MTEQNRESGKRGVERPAEAKPKPDLAIYTRHYEMGLQFSETTLRRAGHSGQLFPISKKPGGNQ